MDKNTLMTWTIVIFLALLLAIPASYAVKKARNLSAVIPADTLAGLQANVPVSPITNTQQTDDAVLLGPGTRGAMYDNVGRVLLTPVRSNISTFAAQDFQLVGEAPTALSNTVAANMGDPEIVTFVFNNKTVVDAFIHRPDVANILSDPRGLLTAAGNESALASFFGRPAIRAGVGSPAIVSVVANSMLMDAVLQSPAAQFVLKNPKAASDIVNKSAILTALKNDKNISAAVTNNKRTRAAAATLLK